MAGKLFLVTFLAVAVIAATSAAPSFTATHTYTPHSSSSHVAAAPTPGAATQYSYGYHVHDADTGDVKSHHESRNGDVVEGSYSFIDADGRRRTVDYTSDAVHGYIAVVTFEPLN